MYQLRCENLELKLNGKQILRSLTFELSGGRINFLIGNNGSGKSSLFSCILQQQKFTGSISLNQQKIANFSALKRAQLFSVVYQQSKIPFHLKTKEYILLGRFPLQKNAVYSKEDHEIVEKIMAELGILKFKDRIINSLSGGEFQKCNIAQALAQNTPIILLDEPTHFLDLRGKLEFYKLLKKLQSDDKKLIFCITHDLDFLEMNNVRVLGLNEGKLVFDSTKPTLEQIKSEVFQIDV